MSRLEIVVRVVVVSCGLGNVCPPAVYAGGAVRAVKPGAVAVLELGEDERGEKFGVAGERHLELSRLSGLGGYHYRAVGRLGTVEGRRCGSREHGDGLDVLRVKVRNGLRGSLGVEFRSAATPEVIHRDTVDDVERVG